MATKFSSARPHDYVYDPCFIVSGERDHSKAAMTAMMRAGEFSIQANFENMFSDLPNCPRCQTVFRGTGGMPTFIDTSWAGRQRADASTANAACVRPLDIRGTDLFKFFQKPSTLMCQYMTPTVVKQSDSCVPSMSMETDEFKVYNRSTQTIFRETSAQTSPWDPGYIVKPGEHPEVLTLAYLAWGKGLPAGMQEVRMIERARMRRCWEARLPPVHTAKDLEERRKAQETMQRDEWAFREAEIQDIQEYRYELICRIYKKRRARLHEWNEIKIKHVWEQKKKYRDAKFADIRHKTQREIRKLTLRNQLDNKRKKPAIFEEYSSFCSEVFAPLMRNGVNPNRAHMKLNETDFKPDYSRIKDMDTIPGWVYNWEDTVPKRSKRAKELGIKESRWTDDNLKSIHEDLMAMRKKVKDGHEQKLCTNLLTKMKKQVERPWTPECEVISEEDEAEYQATVFLQKILRGRAIQALMFEGRNNAKELIAELRSTHNLLEKTCGLRKVVKAQQRFHEGIGQAEKRIKEPLDFLEASSLGFMLDFLNKELWRLEDERRAHAFTLLANRERRNREAAEAGRRQVEERRRREHDEVFKQIMKVHQDTVDLYLEDIIMEGTDNVADEQAREHIRVLAHQIDWTATHVHKRFDELEENELVTDMIHHFLVPEVQKQNLRDRMKQRQMKHLQAAHRLVYQLSDDLLTSDAYQGSTSTVDYVSPSQEAIQIAHDIEDILIDKTLIKAYKAEDDDEYSISQIKSEPSVALEIQCDCVGVCTCGEKLPEFDGSELTLEKYEELSGEELSLDNSIIEIGDPCADFSKCREKWRLRDEPDLGDEFNDELGLEYEELDYKCDLDDTVLHEHSDLNDKLRDQPDLNDDEPNEHSELEEEVHP